MVENLIDFLARCTSGERTLVLIVGGIVVSVLGIWVGQTARTLIASYR